MPNLHKNTRCTVAASSARLMILIVVALRIVRCVLARLKCGCPRLQLRIVKEKRQGSTSAPDACLHCPVNHSETRLLSWNDYSTERLWCINQELVDVGRVVSILDVQKLNTFMDARNARFA